VKKENMKRILFASLTVLLSFHLTYAYPQLVQSFDVGDNIYAADMSHSGEIIALGTVGGDIFVLDSNLRVITESNIDESIIALAVSGRNYTFATIKGEVYYNNQNILNIEKAPNCLDLSNQGYLLVCQADNLSLIINGKEYWTKQVYPRDASITDDGNYIVVAGRDGNLSLFDREGNLIWKHPFDGVKIVRISENGEYISFATDDKVYFADRWYNILFDMPIKVKDMEITGDGSYIICGGDSLILLDRYGHELWNYSLPKGLEKVRISDFAEKILVAYWDGKVEMYNNLKKHGYPEIEKKENLSNYTSNKSNKKVESEKTGDEGNTNIIIALILVVVFISTCIGLMLIKKKT